MSPSKKGIETRILDIESKINYVILDGIKWN